MKHLRRKDSTAHLNLVQLPDLDTATLPFVTLSTDGACWPNPGPGAWAAILRSGNVSKEFYGTAASTTNNRMEFRAMIEGLRGLKKPCSVLIRSDSETAISWAQPHSFKKQKQRAKHPNVWPMVEEFRDYAKPHRISFHWIKGHNGDPDNERCDQICAALLRSRAAF